MAPKKKIYKTPSYKSSKPMETKTKNSDKKSAEVFSKINAEVSHKRSGLKCIKPPTKRKKVQNQTSYTKADVERLQSSLVAKKSKLVKMKERVRTLQSQVATDELTKVELKVLKDSVDKYRIKSAITEKEINETNIILPQEIMKTEELKTQVMELSQQQSDMETYLRECRDKMKSLRNLLKNRNEELQKYKDLVEVFRVNEEDVNFEVDELKKKIEAKRVGIANFEENAKANTIKISMMQKKLDAAVTDVLERNNQLEEGESQKVSDFQKEIQKLSMKLKNFETTTDVEYRKLENLIADVCSTIDQRKKQISDLQVTIIDLQQRIPKLDMKNHTLEQEVLSRKSSHSNIAVLTDGAGSSNLLESMDVELGKSELQAGVNRLLSEGVSAESSGLSEIHLPKVEGNKSSERDIPFLKTDTSEKLQTMEGEEHSAELNEISEVVGEKTNVSDATNIKQSEKPANDSVPVISESMTIGEEQKTLKGDLTLESKQIPSCTNTAEMMNIDMGQNELDDGVNRVSTVVVSVDGIGLSETPSSEQNGTSSEDKTKSAACKSETTVTLHNVGGCEEKAEYNGVTYVVCGKAKETLITNVKSSEVSKNSGATTVPLTVEEQTKFTKDLTDSSERQEPSNRNMSKMTDCLGESKLQTEVNHVSTEVMMVERAGLSDTSSSLEKGTQFVEKVKSVYLNSETLQNVTVETNDLEDVAGNKVSMYMNVKQSEIQPTDNSVSIKSISLTTGEEQATLKKDQTFESEGQIASCSSFAEPMNIENSKLDTGVNPITGEGESVKRICPSEEFHSEKKTVKPIKNVKNPSEMLQNVEGEKQISEPGNIMQVDSQKAQATEKNLGQSKIKPVDNSVLIKSASLMTGEKQTILPKDQIVEIQEQMTTCSNLLEVKDIMLGKGELCSGASEIKKRMTVENETVSTTEKINQQVEKAEIRTLETPTNLEGEEHTSRFNKSTVVSEKGEVNAKSNVKQYDEKMVDNSLTVTPIPLMQKGEQTTSQKDHIVVSEEKMASYSNLREHNDIEKNGELDATVDDRNLIGGGVGLSEIITKGMKLTQVLVKSKSPSLKVETSNKLVNMKGGEEQISELRGTQSES